MKKNRDIAENAKTIKIHIDDIYPTFLEKKLKLEERIVKIKFEIKKILTIKFSTSIFMRFELITLIIFMMLLRLLEVSISKSNFKFVLS
jgi:hypothetical protein